ncbi:MAG: PAS domain S-box protein [Elusimicrobia bacterium]|nr:PAS domain S-box protein [Elusimicrobiota bacterium]
MKSKFPSLFWSAAGVLGAGVALFIGWLLYSNLAQWTEAERELSHSNAAIHSAENLYAQTLGASSRARTFMVTGRQDSLADFDRLVSIMLREANFLRQIARTRPEYAPYSEHLALLVPERIDAMRNSISLRRTGPLPPERMADRIRNGDAITAEIRAVTRDLMEAVRVKMGLLGAQTRLQETQRNRVITIVLIALTFLLLATLAFMLREERRRRKAETGLADANARFQSVLDSATQISIIATDLKGTIILFSAGAERMLGYTAVETVGKATPELIHLPEEISARGEELSAKLGRRVTGFDVFVDAARTGGHEIREWTYVRKDGSRLPVDLMVTGLKDHAGELTGFLGMAIDISARKSSQLRLRKLAAAVRHSPTSIVITDKDANIEYVNPRFLELTGYSEQEVIGKNPRILSSGRNPKELYRDLWDTLLAGKVWRGEFLNKKKDGELFWEHADISPVKDPAGNITSYVAVKLDITDKKQTEAEMAKAKDAALELARMKADFLANMSHEIRTPMNAIIGMTGLLLGTELSPRQRDYARTIGTAGESLLDIINDILDFSKIESGKLIIESMDFDLQETVESTVELLAQRAQDKGLELEQLIEPDVPLHLRGDPGRLRQILTNLLGNAVKFTEHGEVILRIARVKGGDASAVLKFSVKDTGVGIPEEAGGRLFREFTQADASTTRKYGGTGLGLSISKKLAELMGGEIGFESAPGKGSTFWFTLPYELAPEQPPRARPDALKGIRALVVDDNAASREITSSYLALWQMPSEAASSAEQGLAMLRSAAASGNPYRIALVDMQMPGMDGRMLARKIRELNESPGLKIVLQTSLGREMTREELEGENISVCIHKPTRPSTLLRAVNSALFGEAGQESAQAPKREPSPLSRYFRILLAEDNPVNQKVAMRQLEKLGYEASLAANGLEAVAAVKDSSFDLVLMDCQMPEMDGFQATREIRRLQADEQRRMPIIAMTANALQGDKEKCLEAGMDAYIPKPVRIEQLETLIARWDAPLDSFTLKDLGELGGDDGGEFLKGIFSTYLKDLPERAGAVRAAVAANEPESLRQAAHALKGSSGNIGARRLQKICLMLEQAGRAATTEGVAELMKAFELEVPAVVKAIEELASGKA